MLIFHKCLIFTTKVDQHVYTALVITLRNDSRAHSVANEVHPWSPSIDPSTPSHSSLVSLQARADQPVCVYLLLLLIPRELMCEHG